MSLIKILSNTVQYSPTLAKRWGIECAAAFHYIIPIHGFNRFKENDLEDMENDTGVNISVLKTMKSCGALKKDGEYFILNKNHPAFEEFEEMDEFELAMLSAANKISYTIFEDEAFEKLLNTWNEEVVKARLGRLFSKTELQLKFGDATYEVAMSALEYSYKGKYITINPDYAKQRLERTGDEKASGGFKGGFKAGGNKGAYGGGNSHGKTSVKPTSSFSDRTIRLEEGG